MSSTISLLILCNFYSPSTNLPASGYTPRTDAAKLQGKQALPALAPTPPAPVPHNQDTVNFPHHHSLQHDITLQLCQGACFGEFHGRRHLRNVHQKIIEEWASVLECVLPHWESRTMSLVACPVAQDPSHAWSEACAERRNSMKIELSVSVQCQSRVSGLLRSTGRRSSFDCVAAHLNSHRIYLREREIRPSYPQVRPQGPSFVSCD